MRLRDLLPKQNPWDMPMTDGTMQPVGIDEAGNRTYRDIMGRGYAREAKPAMTMRDFWAKSDEMRAPKPSRFEGDAVVSALLNGFTAPARALAGEAMTLGDVIDTAGTATLSAAPMRAPEGALRMGAMRGSDDMVTVYHGTTREAAEKIKREGVLRSAGEPDVYVTTDPTGGGYGDGSVVALRVPRSALSIDDEFPNGRIDYRINVRKPGGSIPVQVAPQTPAQEVADLLASGKAAQVTDELMAQVDPQEMWRLYESGATGVDMPMDAASRAARAGEMGYDQTYFKGMYPYDSDTGPVKDWKGNVIDRAGEAPVELQTINRPTEFPTFYRPSGEKQEQGYKIAGVMGRDVEVANRFAAWPESAVYPLQVRHGREYAIDAQGGLAGPTHFFESGKPFRDAMRSGQYDIGLINNTSDEGSIAFVLRPENIRSQFARFDPRLRHLANLSAGVGGIGMAMQPQTDNTRVLRDYLNGI